jgi:hypothetical protein
MYRLIAMTNQAGETGSPFAAKCKVPAGITLFPREIQFPQEWAERTVYVRSYKKMPHGGHFAAAGRA